MALTYKFIASQIITTNTATVTFDNIPNTYTHLQFKISAASTTAQIYGTGISRLNDVSTGIPSERYISDGSGSGAYRDSSILGGLWGYSVGGTGSANTFSCTEVNIFNYQSSLVKWIVGDFGVGQGSSASSLIGTVTNYMSGNTSAVTKVTFLDPYGGYGSTAPYSNFYLYGILKA